MRITRLAIAVALACAAMPACADAKKERASPRRYTFNRVDDGFLRLDNVSGRSRSAVRMPSAGRARRCRKTAPRWRRKSRACRTRSRA